MQIFAIAAGGALGAIFRFWVSNGIYALLGRNFPYGTLAVNVLGSLLMGFLYVMLVDKLALGPQWRAALLIGLLGAFTTFSAFALETGELLRTSSYLYAAANVLGQNLLGLTLLYAGATIGRMI